MRTSRVLWWVTGLNLAAMAVIAFVVSSRRASARAEHTATVQRLTQFDTESGKLRVELARLKEEETRAAANRTAVVRAEHAATPARVQGGTDSERGRDGAAAKAQFDAARDVVVNQLRSSPEYAGYLVRNARREVLRRQGAILEALQLPPEKLERLKQLLTDRELALADASSIAQSQGEPANGPVAAQLRANIEKENEAQIRELLGEESYAAYQDRRVFEPGRRAVFDNCNAALVQRGLPAVTEEQALACYHNQKSISRPTSMPQSREEWGAIARPMFANTGLSSEQVSVLLDEMYVDFRKSQLRFEARRKAAAQPQ